MIVKVYFLLLFNSISQNYFAFASDTFGSKTRQKFAIHKIAAVSKKEDAIHVEWSDKTVYVISIGDRSDFADLLLIGIYLQNSKTWTAPIRS